MKEICLVLLVALVAQLSLLSAQKYVSDSVFSSWEAKQNAEHAAIANDLSNNQTLSELLDGHGSSVPGH